MTGVQQAVVALNAYTQAMHQLVKLHEQQIALLRSDNDRLQQHVEGLMARIAVLDKRRRK